MGERVRLPRAGGSVYDYAVKGRFLYAERGDAPRTRIPYAAVHVVADPLADVSPVSPAAIDWERTLAFRRHIWSYGLGVAEAMDTAQRGMGLDWGAAKELIKRSVAEAKAVGGRIVCGAQTDHLEPGSARTLRDIEAAYEEQCGFVDQHLEIAMRRRLPDGVHMFTGDDFDYPTTIAGDGERYSDALLGAFDLIAPAASAALTALDEGRRDRFDAILEPTVPVSRHAFGAPTFYYKTGIVFVAYLNGYQDHFRMVGGLESGRSAVHLAELFVLADTAGLLRGGQVAVGRGRPGIALGGGRAG